MRLRTALWALLLAILALFSGVRLASGRAVETDLLAMLPETEKNPAAEQAVLSLARTTQDRMVLLVRGSTPEGSPAAARALAAGLVSPEAFGDVQCDIPPVDPGDLVRFYTPYRLRLAPCGLDLASAPAAVGPAIEARLSAPGFTGVPPALDPLGGFGGFLAGLPFQSTGLDLKDGLLTVDAPEGRYILVSASLKGSAFDPGTQDRVLRAVAAGERALKAADPGAETLRTGVVFYAADARRAAEREVNLLSLLSALAIFGLYVAVFRSLRHLLLGLACVAMGLAAGMAFCLAIFGKLHLLTLVCGSSVLGVSVDYAFLYFAHHLGAGKTWEPRRELRRLLPALLLGLVTTLLGYAALLAAPFPGLRQIAVFSIVGLTGAFGTVVFLLPAWLQAPSPERPALLHRFARLTALGRRASAHPRLPVVVVAALLLLGAGALRLKPHDDVQGLIQPSAALRRDEARIQSLLKISAAGAFFLVEGADEGQVLAREEALRARLPLPGVASLLAVSSFVPSPQRQEAALASHRAALPLLYRGLRDAGFRPEAQAALDAGLLAPPLTAGAFLGTQAGIPFRLLWLGPSAHGVASIVMPTGAPEGEALRQATRDLPGVSVVDKARSVTELLAHFRVLATWALAGAVVLVGLLLAAWYGLRPGLRILAPSVLGMLAALVAGQALGLPFTLFTVMALILALGFGVDYTVFLREGRERTPAAALGVGLASYGTLVSYGFLALSHTPALRGFGLTLALAVAVAVACSFMALPGEEA